MIRYCATNISDIDNFKDAVRDMGGRLIANPIMNSGVWQAWFEVDSALYNETLTYLKIKTGAQDYVLIETNVL